MQKQIQAKSHRRTWLIMAAVVLLFLGGGLAALHEGLSPLVRKRFVRALKEHFDSDVDVKNFHVSVFPHISATGEELVFRHKGRTDVPPLISVRWFSAETGLSGLFGAPIRIRNVRLEGLQLHVPPRQHKSDETGGAKKQPKRRIPSFVIEEINADGTFLEILPKKAGKLPLEFNISRLTLHSAGTDRPMSFRATLTNPKPPGLIESTGKFGPWQRDEPSLTPVSGSYTFQNADLSVFRGISGILSSDGKYQGVLERIEVQGQTDTPDFTVTSSGTPVHLRTDYNAVVDGTNGDTLLVPVNAQIINSQVLAHGGVTGTPGVKGKTVSLDVTVDKARLEDLLRLAVKADKSPLTGVVSFKTKFELPPGDQDIIDKLYLNGSFGIESARFTSFEVQQKVEILSRRGKGQTKENNSNKAVSDLKGAFTLKGGTIEFSTLSFGVPGAKVQLSGTYGLRNEEFDFRGTLKLDSKLSKTTTGIKSFLLKAIDPLFMKKDAGAVLPIKVTGTRSQPSFGLDIARAIPGK